MNRRPSFAVCAIMLLMRCWSCVVENLQQVQLRDNRPKATRKTTTPEIVIGCRGLSRRRFTAGLKRE